MTPLMLTSHQNDLQGEIQFPWSNKKRLDGLSNAVYRLRYFFFLMGRERYHAKNGTFRCPLGIGLSENFRDALTSSLFSKHWGHTYSQMLRFREHFKTRQQRLTTQHEIAWSQWLTHISQHPFNESADPCAFFALLCRRLRRLLILYVLLPRVIWKWHAFVSRIASSFLSFCVCYYVRASVFKLSCVSFVLQILFRLLYFHLFSCKASLAPNRSFLGSPFLSPSCQSFITPCGFLVCGGFRAFPIPW